jgi:flagellar biosynthesis protein
MKKKPVKAAALKYRHRQDNAPMVTAKGVGESARMIIEIAHAYGIPVEEDSDLVEVLSALDLYQEIPPDLYRAVAELLAFVYMISGKIRV